MAIWNGTDGEPKEELDEEPNEATAGASESDEETGSASAWASSESRRDLLMKSSSVRRGKEGTEGREDMIEEARVGGWKNKVIIC
jgi:hypothetical protein